MSCCGSQPHGKSQRYKFLLFQSAVTYVEKVNDAAEFKKVLRTKINVLVAFGKGGEENGDVKKIMSIMNIVGDKVYGKGTLVVVNCE